MSKSSSAVHRLRGLQPPGLVSVTCRIREIHLPRCQGYARQSTCHVSVSVFASVSSLLQRMNRSIDLETKPKKLCNATSMSVLGKLQKGLSRHPARGLPSPSAPARSARSSEPTCGSAWRVKAVAALLLPFPGKASGFCSAEKW